MRVIGLTIGPIFETITSAPSPLALWYSSFIFSNISKELCLEIEKDNDFEFISPAHSKDIDLSDGVGKYHDRIIVIDNKNREIKEIKELFNKIINDVIFNATKYFPKDFDEEKVRAFLYKYIQIHYAIKDINDSDQIILSISQELDSLELMNEFNSNNEYNPFDELFFGEKEEKRNELLKETSLFELAKEKGQVQIDGKIRSIESIVRYSEDKKFKKNRYFAVVNADGDRMGKLLGKLINKNDCIDFSKLLLEHAKDSSQIIKEFGGMTIYAGGDDLLFLAPIVDENNTKTILDLCNELSNEFDEKITKFIEEKKDLLNSLEANPSLSFGLSIQYYKYPLYEALNNCFSLLTYAKEMEDGKRNRCIVNVNLHSGQNFDFVYNNKNYKIINRLFDEDRNEKKYITIINHVKEYINSIKLLDADIKDGTISKEHYKNVMINFFDNDDQKNLKEYILDVFDVYYEILRSDDPIQAKTTLKDEKEKNIRGLISLLMFIKFINEKEDA